MTGSRATSSSVAAATAAASAFGDGPAAVGRRGMAAPYRFRRRMGPDEAHREAAPASSDLEAILSGDLSDDDALRRVLEGLAAAHASWGWVGVYLLVGDTLVLGP